MEISEVHYVGTLRTEAIHQKSGQTIHTDAPPDNKGKGEAFSPTDLLATSLATCMITLMGIRANEHDIQLEDVEVAVSKEMASEPRRVSAIRLEFEVSAPNLTDGQQETLEEAAINCPVAQSISQEIEQDVNFTYK